jgi:hypothetical protein
MENIKVKEIKEKVEYLINEAITLLEDNYDMENANVNNPAYSTMIKFNHWIDSIAFYKKWQKQYKEGDYYTFLIKSWGAPNMEKYIQTLKQIRI